MDFFEANLKLVSNLGHSGKTENPRSIYYSYSATENQWETTECI